MSENFPILFLLTLVSCLHSSGQKTIWVKQIKTIKVNCADEPVIVIVQMSLLDLAEGSTVHLMPNTLVGTGR